MNHQRPPVARTILPPEGGWKERTYYAVDVSFKSTNPIHRSIFFTGFLNGGNSDPGGYNGLFNTSYDGESLRFSDCHYLKVIRELEVES